MLLMRPVAQTDLEALFRLAERAGAGMTSLPTDRDTLEARIHAAARSFGGSADADTFLMVLEDDASGTILGTSAVYANIGVRAPFYSYVMLNRIQQSFGLDLRVQTRTLHVVNEYTGDCEVGTLILDPQARGRGLAPLLTKSRYLLLAQFRHLFGRRVIAELRGWVDAQQCSPFWDCVGSVFFRGLSFREADHLSATTNNQFISDLMPEYPIYVDLLPEAAQAVIGKPHDEGRAAYNMLLAEGFHFEDFVDVFDAGPTVHARVEDVYTVRHSELGQLARIATPGHSATPCIVCNTTLENFRAAQVLLHADVEGHVTLDAESARGLGLGVGDRLRFYALRDDT